MFGYVPAKDLYLVELSMIRGIKYEGSIRTTYYSEESIYAIAKKVGHVSVDYIDIFSGTTYKHWEDVSEKGVAVVRKAAPLMTISKYVKIDDLRNLLIEKNNICYDEKIVRRLAK